jgi:hypothetical protein
MSQLTLKTPNGAINLVPEDGAGSVDIAVPRGNLASEDVVIGVGQTWQDVKASRSDNVTYTNSTDSTIVALITMQSNNANDYANYYIDGALVAKTGYGSNGAGGIMLSSVTLLIPAGSTYKVDMNEVTAPTYWYELR